MGRVRAVAVLAGLGMAAYWAGEAADVRIPKYFGWMAALAFGAEYVWLAFLLGFGAIAAAQLVWERHRAAGWWNRAALLAAAGAALAPVGIGVANRSVMCVVAAMALMSGLWNGLGKQLRDRSAGTGNLLPALAVAVCLEAGIGAVAAGRLSVAAALAAIGTWVFLWGRKQKGWVRTKREAERWPTPVRIAGMLALSILLCAFAVVRYPARLSPVEAAGDSAKSSPPPRAPKPQPEGGTVGGGDWPGVVVYPEVQARTILLPPLPNLRKDPFGRRRESPEPLTIPFFGAYWYFRKPDERPPDGSPIMRGTPEKMRFLTFDGRPIQMEARQNLSTFIDIAGCAAIQLEIRNADGYPGTVWVRLLLADTVKLMEWDLGEEAVRSTPRWRPGGGGGASEETLTFALEGTAALGRFDEFRVVYRMKDMRWDRSAKVGIQKFVLLPRTGLSGPV